MQDGTGTGDPELIGTFEAPVTEPDPPVPHAIEDLAVTVTCTVGGNESWLSWGEGRTTTTYVFPDADYALELFAGTDGEQPTIVTPPGGGGGGGVIAGAPTFTG